MFLKEGNHEALKYIWALLVTESILEKINVSQGRQS